MRYAYTTTTHHFGQCEAQSVHRKWLHRDEVEILFEREKSGGMRDDQITLHLNTLNAKRLCKSLLNIIGNDHAFHKDLEAMMRIQRTPE